jgi:hypothetical protein
VTITDGLTVSCELGGTVLLESTVLAGPPATRARISNSYGMSGQMQKPALEERPHASLGVCVLFDEAIGRWHSLTELAQTGTETLRRERRSTELLKSLS